MCYCDLQRACRPASRRRGPAGILRHQGRPDVHWRVRCGPCELEHHARGRQEGAAAAAPWGRRGAAGPRWPGCSCRGAGGGGGGASGVACCPLRASCSSRSTGCRAAAAAARTASGGAAAAVAGTAAAAAVAGTAAAAAAAAGSSCAALCSLCRAAPARGSGAGEQRAGCRALRCCQLRVLLADQGQRRLQVCRPSSGRRLQLPHGARSLERAARGRQRHLTHAAP